MINTGTKVAYRGGDTPYEAILTTAGWRERKFTIVSMKTGRKRYNVPEKDLIKWDERTPIKAVQTSLGRVRRPKTWRDLDCFSGGARKTFIDQEWVYKRGHGDWGRERCIVEAARYAVQSGKMTMDQVKDKWGTSVYDDLKYYSEVPVAECYLLEDGTLMMERVTPIRSLQAGEGAPSMSAEERNKRGFGYGGSAVPAWANHVDSQQIGLTRKGELVAYDL